ncbi:AzlD domain-containing protein [Acinetobacter calcoaceticus]|uniref:AzlD domain-containing protein n=1 Tax=Acinetobacter calcoaceticus TaxID=471 RepID=UPI002B2ABCD5|nr:AzlD domain-containing protein [Acinetobacter baumannii]
MSWFLLIILAIVVFMNRYILLEPNIPLRLPKWFQQSLQYSAPCLLTAIATPIVFMGEDGAFRSTLLNPYFLTTLITIVIAYKVKHTLLTIILSLACFYGLVFWLP